MKDNIEATKDDNTASVPAVGCETTGYALDITERQCLYNWYIGRAKYQSDCASTQKTMAKKYTDDTTETFGDDLLHGERKTPANWMLRYRIYKDNANALRRRARVFAA